jgi:hypothetical protein
VARASSEAMFTSVPAPCSRKICSAARAPWTLPKKSVSITRRKSSAGVSAKAPSRKTPALLTQMSMRPNRSTARLARASTACWSVTSVGIANAAPRRRGRCRCWRR